MKDVCNTCGKAPFHPFRAYGADGSIISGCVDDFHTDAMLDMPVELPTSRWHFREEAACLRSDLARFGS